MEEYLEQLSPIVLIALVATATIAATGFLVCKLRNRPVVVVAPSQDRKAAKAAEASEEVIVEAAV